MLYTKYHLSELGCDCGNWLIYTITQRQKNTELQSAVWDENFILKTGEFNYHVTRSSDTVQQFLKKN